MYLFFNNNNILFYKEIVRIFSKRRDKKNTVYVITPDHEIKERIVTLGLETPDKYEVVSGLNEGDLVMIGNRAQIQPGQKVALKFIQVATAL